MAKDAILKDSVKEIKGTYSVPDADAFAMWVLAVFHFQNDLSELSDIYSQSYELLQEYGPGDQCLDAFHYEENSRSLFLYQAKYTNSPTTKHGISDAREIATALNALYSDSQSKHSLAPARDQAAQALKDVIQHDGKIILRAVSGGIWKDFLKQDVLKCVDSTLQPLVEIELIDLASLIEHAARITEDLTANTLDFNLYSPSSNQSLFYDSQDIDGVGSATVVMLSARSIGEAANAHQTRLFDKNVRTFLGATGRVNREIIEALSGKESAKRFWYSHNGITILCDGFEFVQQGSINSLLKIDNPQIVNGCQTASSLGQALKRGLLDEFDPPVLARVIELNGDPSTKEDLAGTIAFGTNNQSPINLADLRANDPRQKYYEKILDSATPPWYYERKRMAWKNLRKDFKAKAARYKGSPPRVITREQYQQAWRSFTGKPSEAVTQKGAVWNKTEGSSEGLYEQVFDYERTPEHVIFVSKLLGWFLEVFKIQSSASLCVEINKTLKHYTADISSSKMLVSCHSVALFGYLVKKQFGKLDTIPNDKLVKAIGSLDQGNYVKRNWGKRKWNVFEPELRLIMGTWSNYCMNVKNDDESLYRKLKEHKALSDLEIQLENQMESVGTKALFKLL